MVVGGEEEEGRGARSRGDPPHRHSQGLRRRLRGAAVALVPRAVGQGAVHLLLEDVRQGMQGDAADGGRVVAEGVGVENAALGGKNKENKLQWSARRHLFRGPKTLSGAQTDGAHL